MVNRVYHVIGPQGKLLSSHASESQADRHCTMLQNKGVCCYVLHGDYRDLAEMELQFENLTPAPEWRGPVILPHILRGL